jgi:transposase
VMPLSAGLAYAQHGRGVAAFGLLNAILYVNRTGIAWRYLPHDLPPWQTVYGYYTAWTQDGIFTELNYQIIGLLRDKTGRHREPSAAIMDSQSVKTSTNMPLTTQGVDAGKKIVGRKHGIVTDTLGLLLAVVVTAASVSDNRIGTPPTRPRRYRLPHPGQNLGRRRLQSQVIEHGARLGIDVEVVTKDPQLKASPWSNDAGSSNAPWAGSCTTTASCVTTKPPGQRRQHDHHRDDRQPRQTPHRRKEPNLARHLNPDNTQST